VKVKVSKRVSRKIEMNLILWRVHWKSLQNSAIRPWRTLIWSRRS
jgi:hypothetical protein